MDSNVPPPIPPLPPPPPIAPLPEPAPPEPNSPGRIRWLIHLVLIALYLFIIAFVGLDRTEAARGPALSHTTSGLLKVTGLELLAFGVIFGLAWLASRASVDDLRLRWRHHIMPVLLGLGYSVALRIAVAIVAVIVGVFLVLTLVLTKVTTLDGLENYVEVHRPAVENAVDIPALRDNPAYYWLTLTVVSFILAGVREELWRSAFLAGMKGVWPRQFGSRKGQIYAVLICAVIFGLGHLSMGILAASMAGVLGVGLGLIMVFHRSIWPAVFAHGFFDATTMALLPLVWDVMKNLPKS
jgi:membrane protease YdiL (CAAX protease family)